jgi:hypothetical protein
MALEIWHEGYRQTIEREATSEEIRAIRMLRTRSLASSALAWGVVLISALLLVFVRESLSGVVTSLANVLGWVTLLLSTIYGAVLFGDARLASRDLTGGRIQEWALRDPEFYEVQVPVALRTRVPSGRVLDQGARFNSHLYPFKVASNDSRREAQRALSEEERSEFNSNFDQFEQDAPTHVHGLEIDGDWIELDLKRQILWTVNHVPSRIRRGSLWREEEG